MPGEARALSLTSDAQMGVSKSSTTADQYRVWARRSDGHLIGRRDTTVGLGSFEWQDFGLCLGAHQVGTNGVAATWWTVAGALRERSAFIAANGGVCTYVVNAGGPPGWETFSVPPGKTMTGRVAITWSYKAGAVRVHLFATTTDGWLMVNTYDPVNGNGAWIPLESGISTTGPLAASNSPDGQYARVFAVKTGSSSTVWMERTHDGGVAWDGQSAGPPAGVSACGTMAASEAQVSTGLYKIRLFCTNAGGAGNNNIYVATGDGVDDLTVNFWNSLPLAAGETTRNSGYAIAATRRPSGNYNSIDAYVLNSATPDTKIYVVRTGVNLGTLDPLLVDLETTQRVGGMAAAPTSVGYSYVFYTGKIGSAYRLYRGLGDPQQSSNWSWRNHQSADPWRVPLAVSSPGHAEGMMALHRGKGALVSIVRPGPDPADNAYIELTWSNDDGDTWGAPFTFNDANGLNNGMDYVSDPTVDFTDIGDGQRAYIMMLGKSSANGTCGSWSASSLFYVTTQNGLDFAAPVEVATAGSTADHPWLGIYRNPNGADRFHVTWVDGGVVYYSTKLGNGAWSNPPVVIEDDAGQAGPPALTVGAGGQVYIVYNANICRVNPTFDGCETSNYMPSDLVPFTGDIPIPGTNDPLEHLRAGGTSVRASRSDAKKVYYAFAARESVDPSHFDVFLSEIQYDNSVPPHITFGPRVRVTQGSAYEDARDQFTPAVSLSGDTDTNPLIGVSWYDRRQGDGDCDNQVNRCFRTRRSISTDGGASFVLTQTIPIAPGDPVSDPHVFPYHCEHEHLRFHGDYHEVNEDKLHGPEIVTGAPFGSPDESSGFAMVWFSAGYYLWAGP